MKNLESYNSWFQAQLLIVIVGVIICLWLIALVYVRLRDIGAISFPVSQNIEAEEVESAPSDSLALIQNMKPHFDELARHTSFRMTCIANAPKYAGFIDRIYSIVLPKREEQFLTRIEKAQMMNNMYMFNAIPGKTTDFTPLFRAGIVDEGYFKASNYANGHACTLSHLCVLAHFLKSNLQNCFVIEDDPVDMPENTPEYMKAIYDEAMERFPNLNMISYGYNLLCTKKKPEDSPLTHDKGKVWKPDRKYGTHAYFITREGAEQIIKNVRPIRAPVDVHFTWLVKEKKIRTVIPAQRLFNQDQGTFGSELGNDMKMPDGIPPQFDYNCPPHDFYDKNW